jgi:hypothetical protein
VSSSPSRDKIKDYKLGICCFSAKYPTLRRKSNDWLARTRVWVIFFYQFYKRSIVLPTLNSLIFAYIYIYIICFTYSKGLKCLTLLIIETYTYNLPFSFCYYYFLLRFYQLFFISLLVNNIISLIFRLFSFLEISSWMTFFLIFVNIKYHLYFVYF